MKEDLFKTEIYLTCSFIFEKLENCISIELCSKDFTFESGFIVGFRTLSIKCKDVLFLSSSGPGPGQVRVR